MFLHDHITIDEKERKKMLLVTLKIFFWCSLYSAATLGITTLSIMTPRKTGWTCLAGRHYAGCRYARWLNAECRGALFVLDIEGSSKESRAQSNKT